MEAVTHGTPACLSAKRDRRDRHGDEETLVGFDMFSVVVSDNCLRS